jgi:ABC-type uncharacterized transport system auxiliary subunit
MSDGFRVIVAAALAVALGGIAGCGAAHPTDYYQLSIPVPAAAPVTAAPGAYPVSLLVARFTAPEIYRGDDMVYRSGPNQLGIYEYHRWASSPPEMLEIILARRLRESGRYRSVEVLRSKSSGDFILRGRLFNFDEVDGPPLGARVSFEVDLEDAATGKTLWSQSYAHEQAVEGKGGQSVSAVVEALDADVTQGMGEIVAGLDHYFSAHPPR